MKQVVFSLDNQSPPGVFAACKAACLQCKANGTEAEVRTDDGATAELVTGADTADILFVCDDPARMKTMQEQGLAVIALQHAGNASERFSGAKYIFFFS